MIIQHVVPTTIATRSTKTIITIIGIIVLLELEVVLSAVVSEMSAKCRLEHGKECNYSINYNIPD